jgi:hypothetical protein
MRISPLQCRAVATVILRTGGIRVQLWADILGRRAIPRPRRESPHVEILMRAPHFDCFSGPVAIGSGTVTQRSASFTGG